MATASASCGSAMRASSSVLRPELLASTPGVERRAVDARAA